MLVEKTLLKTAYHFLLLLVGFDTLTYRKDYNRSLILVGHHTPILEIFNIEAFVKVIIELLEIDIQELFLGEEVAKQFP